MIEVIFLSLINRYKSVLLHGPFTPTEIDKQSVHYCSFLETSMYLEVLFAVYVQKLHL